jgi:hypothetical protein
MLLFSVYQTPFIFFYFQCCNFVALPPDVSKVIAKWRDVVIPLAQPVTPFEVEASTVQVSLSIEYLFTEITSVTRPDLVPKGWHLSLFPICNLHRHCRFAQEFAYLLTSFSLNDISTLAQWVF